MQYTSNYNLAKPDANDKINPLSREAYNGNLDTIDEKIKEASENGGVYVGPTEPTNVDVWIDTDEEGADFCYVGDTEPPNDGSVAVWVDTSDKAIKTLVGGVWNNVYDVATTSSDGLMSSADKVKLDALPNNFKVVHLTKSGFTFTDDNYFQKAYTIPTGYTIVDIQVHLTNATALASAMYRDGNLYVFAGRWSSNTLIPGGDTWAFNLYILLAKNDIIE